MPERSPPNDSPLSPIFAGTDPTTIPAAFREQFLYSATYPYDVALDGSMLTIWHKPLLTPLFRLLGALGILVPFDGHDVPARLDVRGGRTSSGVTFHQWNRTLRFERPVQFDTTIVYDAALDKVADLVGPRGLLYMVWDAKYLPPRRFTLDTAACAIRVGSRRVWLPAWLWRFVLGTVRFVQEADATAEDTVRINLRIDHPIFGEVFRYEGLFKAVRVPADLAWRERHLGRGIVPE